MNLLDLRNSSVFLSNRVKSSGTVMIIILKVYNLLLHLLCTGQGHSMCKLSTAKFILNILVEFYSSILYIYKAVLLESQEI